MSTFLAATAGLGVLIAIFAMALTVLAGEVERKTAERRKENKP